MAALPHRAHFYLFVDRPGLGQSREVDARKRGGRGSGGNTPAERLGEGFSFVHTPGKGGGEGVAGADRAQRLDAGRERLKDSFGRCADRSARLPSERITDSGPMA